MILQCCLALLSLLPHFACTLCGAHFGFGAHQTFVTFRLPAPACCSQLHTALYHTFCCTATTLGVRLRSTPHDADSD
eukprot:3932399-Rhodomonas_salina.2